MDNFGNFDGWRSFMEEIPWWSPGHIFKAMLVDETFRFDESTLFVDEIVSEVRGGSYTRRTIRGRRGLANESGDAFVCTADAVRWPRLYAGARTRIETVLVFHERCGVDRESVLVCARPIAPVVLGAADADAVDFEARFDGGIFTVPPTQPRSHRDRWRNLVAMNERNFAR